MSIPTFFVPLHPSPEPGRAWSFPAALGRVTTKYWPLCRIGSNSVSVNQSEQHFRKLVDLGHLVGSVAHDFNNLFTAILGSTDLLLEMLPAGHPGREEAEEVRKAALRAADLTRQLLDASIEAGQS